MGYGKETVHVLLFFQKAPERRDGASINVWGDIRGGTAKVFCLQGSCCREKIKFKGF